MAPTRALVVEADDNPTTPGEPCRAYHPDLPGLRMGGRTPCEAATALLRRLTTEWDSVADRWHRADLDRVIAEVRAYLEPGSPVTTGHGTAWRLHRPRTSVCGHPYGLLTP